MLNVFFFKFWGQKGVVLKILDDGESSSAPPLKKKHDITCLISTFSFSFLTFNFIKLIITC